MGVLPRRLGRPELAPAVGPRPPRTARAFLYGWAASVAALCGAGLLVGIPSRLVPDALEPAVGVGLLTLAARSAFRARRARP